MSRASAAFEPCAPEVADDLLCYLRDRYGLSPDVFAGHRFWHRLGTPAIWMAARDTVPLGPWTEAIGLCAFRDPPPRGKPSTVFLQRFGAHATRGVVEVGDAGMGPFLMGEPFPAPSPTLRGWVIVRWAGVVLGRGWAQDGEVRSEIKRSWREGLEIE